MKEVDSGVIATSAAALSSGEAGGEPIGLATDDEDWGWRHRLIQQFKALDTVVVTLQRKRTKPVFAEVMRGVEALTPHPFDEASLAKLVLLSGGAHHVQWAEAPRTDASGQPQRPRGAAPAMTSTMVVAINDSWMQSHGAERASRISYAARQEAFGKLLDKCPSEPAIENIYDVLPQRPEAARKRQAEDQVLNVARVAEETKRQRKAEVDSILTSTVGTASINSASDNKDDAVDSKASIKDGIGVSSDSGVNKVEALKALLMARRKAEAEAEQRKAALRAAGIEEERLQRIPLLCNTLRMYYQRQNRTSVNYNHLLNTLSRETRYSREELRKLVDLLCEIAPEFICIIPPDEIVSEPFLKLNEYCDYKTCVGNIRSRIQQMLLSRK